MKQHCGLYYYQGILLDVRLAGNQLVATMPDLPTGYEIRFESAGDNQFRVVGGAVNGALVSFGDRGIEVGTLCIERIASADNLPITRYSTVPSWTLSAEHQAAFDQLLATCGDGEWLTYDLPYPKYQFLQYVTAQDHFIFHGSNNQKIEEFAPQRKSVELRDETGRGNHQAVYGTHEALWSLFFAIVDREKLDGSIRNGVAYYFNAQNETLPLFNFSVNELQLHEEPYCAGALFFLPRDSFERVPLMPSVISNEWVCAEPVKPLAKLRVTPADFPFEIHGHDDGPLLRLQTLTRELRERAVSAELTPTQFTLTFAEPFPCDEFITLQKTFMPTVQYEQRAANTVLTATNLPPAMQNVLRESYADLL